MNSGEITVIIMCIIGLIGSLIKLWDMTAPSRLENQRRNLAIEVKQAALIRQEEIAEQQKKLLWKLACLENEIDRNERLSQLIIATIEDFFRSFEDNRFSSRNDHELKKGEINPFICYRIDRTIAYDVFHDDPVYTCILKTDIAYRGHPGKSMISPDIEIEEIVDDYSPFSDAFGYITLGAYSYCKNLEKLNTLFQHYINEDMEITYCLSYRYFYKELVERQIAICNAEVKSVFDAYGLTRDSSVSEILQSLSEIWFGSEPIVHKHPVADAGYDRDDIIELGKVLNRLSKVYVYLLNTDDGLFDKCVNYYSGTVMLYSELKHIWAQKKKAADIKRQEEYEEHLLNPDRISTIPVRSKQFFRSSLSINTIDNMSGEEFEEMLVSLFTGMGFMTMKTKTSGDFGIDVIAKKRGISYGIQAKRYSGTVGIKAVQEAHSGLSVYELDRALVITNSYFTKAARTLADKNDITLWDRKELEKRLRDYNGINDWSDL